MKQEHAHTSASLSSFPRILNSQHATSTAVVLALLRVRPQRALAEKEAEVLVELLTGEGEG